MSYSLSWRSEVLPLWQSCFGQVLFPSSCWFLPNSICVDYADECPEEPTCSDDLILCHPGYGIGECSVYFDETCTLPWCPDGIIGNDFVGLVCIAVITPIRFVMMTMLICPSVLTMLLMTAVLDFVLMIPKFAKMLTICVPMGKYGALTLVNASLKTTFVLGYGHNNSTSELLVLSLWQQVVRCYKYVHSSLPKVYCGLPIWYRVLSL